MGLGLAMTFLPILSVITHHFSRRRGFAIGIMTSGEGPLFPCSLHVSELISYRHQGASIGGIVFPIMLNKLIHGHQGFGLGVRATAAVITGLLFIANLLVRTRPPVLPEGDPRKRRTPMIVLFKDVPYMTCVIS